MAENNDTEYLGYSVDIKKVQAGIADKYKGHALIGKALNEGWVPDILGAIENWHTACRELNIEQEHVEDILKDENPEDIIECIELCLELQAKEFRAAPIMNRPQTIKIACTTCITPSSSTQVTLHLIGGQYQNSYSGNCDNCGEYWLLCNSDDNDSGIPRPRPRYKDGNDKEE